MSARFFPWLLVMFMSLLVAAPARAEVKFEVPQDWAQPGLLDSSARVRAQGWADALGGHLERTEGSGRVDEFVETLAVISFNLTMDDDALQSDEAAHAYLDKFMDALVGDASADEVTRVVLPGEGGAVSIRGSYIVGGVRLETVLIPEGIQTSLVVLASQQSDHVLYAPIFRRLLESIEGGSAPIEPFDVEGFRFKYIIGWLLAFVLVYLGSVAAFSERKGDHKRVGSFAAAILVVLAVLASMAVYVMLGDVAAGLGVVGSSARDLSSQVLGTGMLGAVIVFGIAQFLEKDDGVVRSAPESYSATSQISRRIPADPADVRNDSRPAAPRVAPPPSSALKRMESGPMVKGERAGSEPARSEPGKTRKAPGLPED